MSNIAKDVSNLIDNITWMLAEMVMTMVEADPDRWERLLLGVSGELYYKARDIGVLSTRGGELRDAVDQWRSVELAEVTGTLLRCTPWVLRPIACVSDDAAANNIEFAIYNLRGALDRLQKIGA